MQIHDLEAIFRDTSTTLSMAQQMHAEGSDSSSAQEEVQALLGMAVERLKAAGAAIEALPPGATITA